MKGENILLVVLLVGGALSTSWGSILLVTYSQGYSDNIANLRSGIVGGWLPDNSSVRIIQVQMTIAPYTIQDVYTIMLSLGVHITSNSSFPFVFGIITPFTMPNLLVQEKPRDPNYNWTWSSYDTGLGVSALFVSSTLSNRSNTSRNGVITTSATYSFQSLPTRNDHGRHTLILPFGIGTSGVLFGIIQNRTGFFPIVSPLGIDLELRMGLKYVVTGSIPQFRTWKTYPGIGQYPPAQGLNYNINGTSSLQVTYEDPQQIEASGGSQAFGLFWLGLGVPLMVSVANEMAKHPAKKRVSNPKSHSAPSRDKRDDEFQQLPFE